ncbi:MAG: carbohydrate-binding protein [Methylosarcina sp.]
MKERKMDKRIINVQQELLSQDQDWLNLENLVEIEMTSEEVAYPIESALSGREGPGWRAGKSGMQTLRLIFLESRPIRRIRLAFQEFDVERTQEYVLRWSKGVGQPFSEIVRQQWNFSPEGANTEIETHVVELRDVKVLELIITPDNKNPHAIASLKQLRIA